MKYRTLGQSELELPAVSFGAWAVGGWNWGGTDDEAAIRAIQRGIDVGITCVDTAPMYGMGHSERVVGKAIADRRDRVIVATKCGLRWDSDEGESYFNTKFADGTPANVFRNLRPDSVRHECELSLQRLNIDVIDLYQCHWSDSTTPFEDTMDALLSLQQEGKIRAIGVSNFTPELMRIGMAKGVIASNQPKYNALQRDIEADVLPFCLENNIGVLAYSPIAQGLLTGTVSEDRLFPEGDGRRNSRFFTPENRRRVLDMLDQVRPIAEAHEATLGQLFIAWVNAQPGVTSALVGARNETQVDENAKAGDIELLASEVIEIEKHLAALSSLA
jgi:aryl-alcohol dehydrogenase-like predicted oxidoreductase